MSEFSPLDKDLEIVTRFVKTEDPTPLTPEVVTNLLSFADPASKATSTDDGVRSFAIHKMAHDELATAIMEPVTESLGASDRDQLGIMALAMLDDGARQRLLQNPPNERAALNCARYILHGEVDATEIGYIKAWRDKAPDLAPMLEHLHASIIESWDTIKPPSTKLETMTLILHGTMARDADWWKPHTGPFWQYINGLTHDLYGGSDVFRWSGGLWHKDRVLAAQQLKTWVDKHPAKKLRVIAHSHGANVCYLAGRLGVKFDHVIALGGPICLQYIPHAQNFGRIDNVFSTKDLVQMGGSALPDVNRRSEGRTLTEQATMTNTWAEQVPLVGTHSSLHEQAVWQNNQLDTLL